MGGSSLISQNQKKPGDEKVKKSHRGTIIAVLLGIVAIAVIAVLIGIIINLTKTKPENESTNTVVSNTGGRGTLVVPENVEQLREQLNQPVENAYYEVNMNVDWTFQTATTPSDNAYVSNSTANERTVYFDLMLKNSNELLYSSPYIPVGASLSAFPLDVELSAGVYDAVCVYHLVDDDGNELATTSIGVKIRILR